MSFLNRNVRAKAPATFVPKLETMEERCNPGGPADLFVLNFIQSNLPALVAPTSVGPAGIRFRVDAIRAACAAQQDALLANYNAVTADLASQNAALLNARDNYVMSVTIGLTTQLQTINSDVNALPIDQRAAFAPQILQAQANLVAVAQQQIAAYQANIANQIAANQVAQAQFAQQTFQLFVAAQQGEVQATVLLASPLLN